MFTLSHQKIDPIALKKQVKNPKSGGFVCFEGWVRNHNATGDNLPKPVTDLHYEAHEKLAVKEGQSILDEALEKFEVNAASCCHRLGQLTVGDMAIWVGVSADHRQVAFAACQWILNQTKARVPIWKNEFYADGESGWVDANL